MRRGLALQRKTKPQRLRWKPKCPATSCYRNAQSQTESRWGIMTHTRFNSSSSTTMSKQCFFWLLVQSQTKLELSFRGNCFAAPA